MKSRVLLSAVAALAVSTLAHADPSESPFSSSGSYSPIVPVSAFARPASWFDPSRLHMSVEASFGTGFNGQSSGLQVTRFSYQLGKPLAMQVSVGNAFGAGAGGSNGQFFLEGLNLSYQPFRSMMITVNYRDYRSPLQMPYGYGYNNALFPFGYSPSGRFAP
jgi:hypothetical protein